MPFVVVAVDTSIPWTTSQATIEFDGLVLTLRAGSQDLYPTVVLEYQGDLDVSFMEGLAVIRRFLSSLAWTERLGVREVEVSGGGYPVQIGRGRVAQVTRLGRWRCDYLAQPVTPKARLALALYREAIQLEHVSVPYAFLGFFKILNIGLDNGPTQKAWTNSALDDIDEHRAVERIARLRASEPDVGRYLYESGRCAVAHAFNDPVVDPDATADTMRLLDDLPVARALAERFIERELGVRSYHTVLTEHLYELEGFRAILGEGLIGQLSAGVAPSADSMPTFPAMTIRLDGREDGVAFNDLTVRDSGAAHGGLILLCASRDARLRVALLLDLPRERLVFEPEGGVAVDDDGSIASIDHAIMKLRFLRGTVLNGRIEVLDTASGRRLGRTDAFIGTNLDLEFTLRALDAEIVALADTRAVRATHNAITDERSTERALGESGTEPADDMKEGPSGA